MFIQLFYSRSPLKETTNDSSQVRQFTTKSSPPTTPPLRAKSAFATPKSILKHRRMIDSNVQVRALKRNCCHSTEISLHLLVLVSFFSFYLSLCCFACTVLCVCVRACVRACNANINYMC